MMILNQCRQHALGDRIARKGAENPAARHILEEAKAKAMNSRKTPLTINAELEEAQPGRAVQGCVAKARRLSQKELVSIQDTNTFLDERTFSPEHPVPTSGLLCLWKTIRPSCCGYVVSFGNMLHTWVKVLEQHQKTWPQHEVVTQVDYTGDLLINNSKVGVIGLPIYHRCKEGTVQNMRWRKALVPGCVVINPHEDAQRYRIGLAMPKVSLPKCVSTRA